MPRLLAKLLGLLLALSLAAAGCSDSDSDDASDVDDSAATSTEAPGDDIDVTSSTAPVSTTVPLPEPVLEDRECDPARVDEVPEEVTYECQWLVVPENRRNFDGDTLKLAVTVLQSPNPDAAADPVVYLSGGPGGTGGNPNYWSTTPLIDERDVIVYDQRGTGASEPDLECIEMEEAVIAAFESDAPAPEERAGVIAGIEACRDRLEAAGVDLTAFSTPESAADLADLRVALGYEEWNLFGISYGTRLAQETMRSHPEGIRSVILDSTYPMNEGSLVELVDGAQYSFEQLAAGCAADETCNAAYGDLLVLLDDVVAQYNAEPYRTTLDLGPDDGGIIDAVLTGDDIVAGLFTAMYDTTLIPALPAFAAALDRGETALMDQVALEGIPGVNRYAEAMALSTNCADSAPVAEGTAEADAELLADPGKFATMLTFFSTEFCDSWVYGPVDDSFVEPVTSDIATLVLAGTYDPVTILPGGQQVADALPNSLFVTFDGVGHGAWDTSECATGITTSFLADPMVWPDVACAAEVPPPAFVVPAE